MPKKLKEPVRTLTPRELARLARLEEITAHLAAQGYAREDRVVSITFANIMALVWALPFVLGFGAWFILRNGFYINHSVTGPLLFLAVMAAFVFVHEGLHGLTWATFAPGHLKAIEFGFMKELLTPYCTCGEPLAKWPYVLGAFMPCLVLGIIPAVAGVLCNSWFWLLMGLVMIVAAGGDLTIIWKLLTYRTDAAETIILDHPTECGFVVFRK